MVFGLLALICIILGFIVGLKEEKFVFDALTWFVAAIAFNTLTVVLPSFSKKE